MKSTIAAYFLKPTCGFPPIDSSSFFFAAEMYDERSEFLSAVSRIQLKSGCSVIRDYVMMDCTSFDQLLKS